MCFTLVVVTSFSFSSQFIYLFYLQIAGDKDENQILLALKMYSDRAGLLQAVLNESYQLYRFGHNLVSLRYTRYNKEKECVIGKWELRVISRKDMGTVSSGFF